MAAGKVLERLQHQLVRDLMPQAGKISEEGCGGWLNCRRQLLCEDSPEVSLEMGIDNIMIAGIWSYLKLRHK